MNKIILDNASDVKLNIKEDSICNINNKNNLDNLDINIEDGVTFILNEYSEIEKRDYKINIKQSNRSNFIYNHSYKVNDLYNLNINISMNGNNSKNTINIHGINDFGKSNVVIDGIVSKDTVDNELYENIKLLNINNGMGTIYPNMYIDTKNVIANHAATITDIDEDYLFYMNSKGIDNDKAKELIIDGFLDNEAR